MGAILDTNWRMLKGNADIVGWPGPDQPAAARRAHNRANTMPGWVTSADDPMSAYQRIARDAKSYAAVGFAAVGFPPSTKGAAGTFSGGYDLLDNYDIGSKKQPYEIPTAFGTATDLRAAIASVHGAGMDAYGDLVLHQYDGFDPTKPFYPPGSGGPKAGRFPKLPSYFVGAPPGVMVDPVPDSNGNFGFGAMPSYTNSTPAGVVLTETIKAAQWLAATTGFDGFRIDDTKGTNAPAVLDLLRAPGLAHLYAFGEYFDGNSDPVWNWVNRLMQRRAASLDFGFHFNVGNICNNNSRAWMGALANIGYCTVDPYMAVPFCESADTDNSPFEQIIWNKMLGYALMLTFPGYKRVYYRDWATDPGCYSLAEPINNLLWIERHLAQGAFVPRLDTDMQVFIHERTGIGPDQPGCVCAFNNDQWNRHTRTVQTTLGPNQRVHEYTGKAGDLWTDYAGRLTIDVPRNDNGMGYLIYGKWITPEGFGLRARATTQTFESGDVTGDLDIPPAPNGALQVARILCAGGTDISVSGKLTTVGWTLASSLGISVSAEDGTTVASVRHTAGSANDWPITRIPTDGWYAIDVFGMNLPAVGSPFTLSVTYTAP